MSTASLYSHLTDSPWENQPFLPTSSHPNKATLTVQQASLLSLGSYSPESQHSHHPLSSYAGQATTDPQ